MIRSGNIPSPVGSSSNPADDFLASLTLTSQGIEAAVQSLREKSGVGGEISRTLRRPWGTEAVLFEASERDRGQVFVIDERVVRGEGVPERKPIRLEPPLRLLLKRRVTR